jgi:digeranylgeranylglycerophospholipid reductase
MSERADAVIVGCGIAGGLLSHRLARDGFKVVALEKRPVVGVPVRCGEAAGSRSELSQYIDIDEDWIVTDINAARMYAPNGTFVEKRLPGVGVMLRRDRFDQALSRQAEDSGAEVRAHQEVTGLLWSGGRVSGVTVKDHDSGHRYTLQSKVTIGADGVEGFVGRWAGLTGHLRPRHIHAAIEYLMEDDGFPRDTIELYLDRERVPGGYAWVFPKGPGRANVGLGIHPTMARDGTAADYLDRFIAAHHPEASKKEVIAGGVSGSRPLKTMVGDGVLLVGEAARQNNPFSGGGIMNALEGAEEAHIVLTAALEQDNLSRENLKSYDEAWHRRNGHLIRKFAMLRELFFKLDNDDLNQAVDVLDKIVRSTPGKITDYAEIFRAAFITAPRILLKAGTLLW